MGERKLNMNIPLMSVRRFSASEASKRQSGKTIEKSQPTRRHTLPTSRAEVSMDQATEPVAVPFHWEQIPGRCKNESGPDHQFPGTASVTPKLPPGRSLSATKTPVKESADGNKIWLRNKAYSFNENSVENDYSKETKDTRAGFDVKEDDEDIFSDAQDTLSQTESFSINYSVSGVSGFDTSTIEQKGTFSSDPQTLDFMMSRFLPAAKAMALQPPQYTSRKQTAVVDRQSQATMQSTAEKRPLVVQNPSNMFLQYGEYKEEEEKSEDEDEVETDTTNILAKGCGLVPGLCFKNSLNLLGPIAGIKMKNQLLLPSTSDCAKSSKGPYLRPYSQTVKKALDAVYNKSLGSTSASPDIHDLRNKRNNNPSKFSYSGELQTTGRSSPFRSTRVAGMSPCRSRTPQSPFRGAKLQGCSKEYLNNKPERSQSAGRVSKILQQVPQERRSISSGPIVEKTLYIDSTSSADKTHSYSGVLCSGHGREVAACKNSEAISESWKPEENSSIDSLHDIQCVNFSEGRNLMVSKVSGTVQSNFRISQVRCQLNKSGEFKLEKAYNSQDKSSEKMRKTFDENPDMKAIQTWVAHNSGNGAGHVDGPLPPPLPKSPSESWLCRTLPLVSLKNSLPYSSQATQSSSEVQGSETPYTNIKWETIVKTSNSRHDHVRYSEELVTHVSQHQ